MTLADLGTYPAARALPAGYDRHRPTPDQLRGAMWALVEGSDWAKLPWAHLLDGLAALGRTDIPLGRLTEGHIDAMRILAEAGRTPRAGALYGVWASRSQGSGLTAQRAGGDWRLDGTLRFASGVGVVDRALIQAWTPAGPAVLLDVDVRTWTGEQSSWNTRAMEVSRSWTLNVHACLVAVGDQIGPPGFYLDRPGFFAGGVGVAAVWAGAAARLADLGIKPAAQGPASVTRSVRVGHLRTELAVAQSILAVAGQMLQRGTPADVRGMSSVTRAGVAAAVRRVLTHVRDLAGPAGLAYATDLTRAVDDLELYVRQLNPDAEAEFLGAQAL